MLQSNQATLRDRSGYDPRSIRGSKAHQRQGGHALLLAMNCCWQCLPAASWVCCPSTAASVAWVTASAAGIVALLLHRPRCLFSRLHLQGVATVMPVQNACVLMPVPFHRCKADRLCSSTQFHWKRNARTCFNTCVGMSMDDEPFTSHMYLQSSDAAINKPKITALWHCNNMWAKCKQTKMQH